MPALWVSEHMAPSPTLAAKRLADLPMRPGIVIWCGPNAGCNMCWHWSACCMHALTFLTPSRRFLMFDVKLKLQLVSWMVRLTLALWKWSQARTHCSNTANTSQTCTSTNFMVALFFPCGTPFTKSLKDIRIAIKFCIELRLGNAMTKLNVNIFGMSRWQIQPMKYQRPRAHETDMDRWSLFDLLLILDHHLLEVPLCGPRVQGCTGGTTWGSITLLGVGRQFQNDKMFMAWQLVPGFALPAASLACYTPWGPDRILASVAATLVHLVQNGLHWNNLFFENESFVMVNW